MFDKFYNRLRVEADLLAETGLHVGAGEDSFSPTVANGSVLRDVTGNPYIPGSSLKGVLRAFLASIYNAEYEKTEDGLLAGLSKADARKSKCLELKKENGVGLQNSEEELLAHYIETESSIIHRLFGSQLAAGKVKLSDAYPKQAVETDFRKGNAIDRDTHTTAQGMLFDTEFIPAGTVFSFRLDAENLTSDESETLIQLLDYFAEGGILVGGRSRAGLGRVKLKNATYTVWTREEGMFPVKQEPASQAELLSILRSPEVSAYV
jgi:CRISPR-associated RAMP protein (TIGR02581 family)